MRAHERHDAEIWVPLAQIRISTRRRRGLSSATVERYREWLEQGREAPPVRLARDGDGFVVREAGIESLPPWPPVTPWSRRSCVG